MFRKEYSKAPEILQDDFFGNNKCKSDARNRQFVGTQKLTEYVKSNQIEEMLYCNPPSRPPNYTEGHKFSFEKEIYLQPRIFV